MPSTSCSSWGSSICQAKHWRAIKRSQGRIGGLINPLLEGSLKVVQHLLGGCPAPACCCACRSSSELALSSNASSQDSSPMSTSGGSASRDLFFLCALAPPMPPCQACLFSLKVFCFLLRPLSATHSLALMAKH